MSDVTFLTDANADDFPVARLNGVIYVLDVCDGISRERVPWDLALSQYAPAYAWRVMDDPSITACPHVARVLFDAASVVEPPMYF